MKTVVWTRRFRRAFIVLASAVLPALIAWWQTPPPCDRYIHIEAFRYGKDPEVIHCNRGDRLHLSFSSRDTAHSFFLEEFDVDAKITPFQQEVAVYRVSDPTEAPRYVKELTLQAECPGWFGWLVSKCQYRCHVWCGPMHAFEHGNLIIHPNWLLWSGWGLLIGMVGIGFWTLWDRQASRHGVIGSQQDLLPVISNPGRNVLLSNAAGTEIDLLQRFPVLQRIVRWRGLQYTLIVLSGVLLYGVIVCGLLGTKVAGRNAAVMLTWVVWLFLLVAILTPLAGRIWCLICPLPAMGEIFQRGSVFRVERGNSGGLGNRFFGLNWPWPQGVSPEWSRTLMMLSLGTFSTAIVAVPRLTAWAILLLVILATVMAAVWRLRSFCVYLCPVGAFLASYGKLGSLAVRAAWPEVCSRCPTHPCYRGNSRGWACPYGLCVQNIQENADCGMCLECFKSCPFDNVTLRWRPFASEVGLRNFPEAWQVIVMFALAAVYCVVHLGPWSSLRDYVNILDKENWHLFAVFAAVVWGFALLGLPALVALVAWLGWGVVKKQSESNPPFREVFLACASTLLPLGFALWVAFVVQMLMVNFTFVLQSLSDPLGWGWNLLGMAGTPWRQLWPEGIPWVQVVCVLAGAYFSLRSGAAAWLDLTGEPGLARWGLLPLYGGVLLLAGAAVWFFAC